jgi:transcriptional regulator with XRE-family HTH domain
MSTKPFQPIFNSRAIREAVLHSGLTSSDIAFRVDLSQQAIQRILDGDRDPGEIRVATLIKFATLIGLPTQDLFFPADPQPPTSIPLPQSAADDSQSVHRDVQAVVGALYDRGQPTLNKEIASAFGWTMDRLQQALDFAGDLLAGVGLELLRTHGETTIRANAHQQGPRDAVAETFARARGLSISDYQTVYTLMEGGTVAAESGMRRKVIFGGLCRLGVIDVSVRETRLTEAALFAHPMLEVQR